MVDVVSRIKMLFVAQGAEKVAKQTERVGRAQTRLGQTSASNGRQFSAQASGLGGLVSVYAGAAANIFALTQAFSALQKAARAEQVVIGTRTLAREIGASGDQIIAKVQEITDGQLSMVETATQLNAALSAGFGEKQIERLTLVSLKASRALGRDLGDAFNRLVRGAAKLEPELIDELGIFTRIEPAVAAYAAANNVAATSLTNFERRQAFLNAVILEGERKFGNIETSGENAQKSMEKLLATLTDLATEFGQFIANILTPLIDFFAKAGNQLVLFGAIGLIVFGKLRTVMGTFIANGINRTSAAFSGLFQKFSAGTKQAISEANDLGAAANEAFKGSGALVGTKAQPLGIAGARAASAEVKGIVSKDFGLAGAIRGKELTKDLVPQLQAKEKLSQLNEQQIKHLRGLELAQDAFNKRVRTSNKLTRAFAITMNKAAGAVRVMGIALKGLMAALNIVMMVVGVLQLVLSFFDIDLFKEIKDLFVDSSQEGRNYKAGLEAIVSETLILGGVNEDLRKSLGLSKEAFKAATASAKDYMIAFRDAARIDEEEGFVEKAAGQLLRWFKDDEFFRVIENTAQARAAAAEEFEGKLKPMQERMAQGTASRAEMATVAAGKIAIANLRENRGVEALAGAYLQLGMSQERAVEISQKYVQQAATSLGPLGRMTFIIPSVVEGFDTMNIALATTQAGFENIDSRLNGVADAAGNLMDRQLNLAEAMTSGNMTAEQSAAALDAYKNTTKKLIEELKKANPELRLFDVTLDEVGKGLGENIEYFANLVRQMQVVATMAKTLRSVFSGSIKLADQLLAKGKLSLQGGVATTPLEERTNQLAFLKATAVLTGDAIILKGKLVDKDKEIRNAALIHDEEAVTRLQEERVALIKTYGLEASLLMRQIELSDTSTKAMVGNYIKAAAEANKLVISQEKYNLKLQVTIDKLKGQIGVQEAQNRLKILQSEQKTAMKNLQIRVKEIEIEKAEGERWWKAAIQRTEIRKDVAENLQATVNLERELNDLTTQRNRKLAQQGEIRQQNLLSAEAARLDAMGPMATPEQRRQAAIDIAEYTYKLEMQAIDRRQGLIVQEYTRSIDDIKRRKDVLDLEEKISQGKYWQATEIYWRDTALAEQNKKIEDKKIADRRAQIEVERDIANKQVDAGFKNAELAFEQRKFELDLLREKYEFLKTEQAIDKDNLAGLATFLQGFGEQVAFFRQAQGTPSDITIIGKERATALAQSIKDSFGTDVTSLGGLLDTADAQNAELYDLQLKKIGMTYRTRIHDLVEEEKRLKAAMAINEQKYLEDHAAAQAALDSAIENRDSEVAIYEQKVKTLEIDKKIADEKGSDALAQLELDRITAQEQLDITKRRAAAERDVMLQLGKEITTLLQDKIGGGIQDLFKALREGTLTMENFKEGAKNLALDILGGIQEKLVEQFIVKPVEDFISEAMSGIFGLETAEVHDGSSEAKALYVRDVKQEAIFREYMEKFGATGGDFQNYVDEQGREWKHLQELKFPERVEGVSDKKYNAFISNLEDLRTGYLQQEREKSGVVPLLDHVENRAPPSQNLTELINQVENLDSAAANAAPAINTVGESLIDVKSASQVSSKKITETAEITKDQAFLTNDQLTGIGIGAVATFGTIFAATGDFKKSMIATFLQMFAQIALMAAQSEMSGGSSSSGGGIFSSIMGLFSGGGGGGGGGAFTGAADWGAGYGDLIIMASGGSVRKFAAGGVMQRDSVPALLEPGEFVIRKPMAKAIGGPALERMNGTGQMPAGNVEINMINKGTPQQATSEQKPSIDGKGIVIDIILKDLQNNGPIKQAMRGGGRR